MIYPKSFEQKIGFDILRQLIKEECTSPLGQSFVDKMRFSDNFSLIGKLCSQVAEFRQILLFDNTFPSQHYLDVSNHLRQAELEGSFLSEEQFFDIKLSLNTILSCLKFLHGKEDTTYPELKELSKQVEVDRKLVSHIDFTIDERGKVRDSASSELGRIRKAIISEQSSLRRKLDNILRSAKSQGFTDEDMQLTIRGGRMVIPVAAEHKRKLKGFIHDESATGQTVFIEPAEVFDANNAIRELEYEERREVIRILTKLTSDLRPYIPALRKGYTFLGLIDFIRAKARLAVQLNAVKPQVVPKQHVEWIRARHPLLQLSLEKQGRTVSPLDILLNQEKRILLISGPNAGGKSIALKTVGLLQYMYQCGMLVPMDENSTIGLFSSIFIDIGDEQSLENDLSTYSSHLSNMKYFLQFADKKTLLLIDEFGTGTEPQFGGAIAESILEQLNKEKAFGVITTHYTNLKFFADKTPGIINGAMRFDAEKLEPLYKLEIGVPGSSFALEIASKIGLPKAVLNNAKDKLGDKQVAFDKLLRELQIEKEVYASRNLELATRERHLKKSSTEYAELKAYLDNQRKTIVNDAKAEAKRLVREANQKIENTIRQIREGEADKEVTRQARKELEDFRGQMEPEPLKQVAAAPVADDTEDVSGGIEAGHYVRIKDSGAVAEVMGIRGKDVEVRIGSLKSTLKLNRLEKISRKAYRTHVPEEEIGRGKGVDINQKMLAFSYNLDLRGKRGEEALTEVDSFLDNALLLGTQELRIVHGKGDGILRTLIRNHLRKYKQVVSMNDEHPDRGGPGVTIVGLNH
jgi:DNA mismatch repair protein MutS2